MSETIPEYSGCLWPVDPACLTDEWESMEESVRTRSLALASSTLHRLTGMRVSACPVVVRPSSSGCCFVPTYDAYGTGSFRPGVSVAGYWVNNCGPVCTDGSYVSLPRPVGRIDEVKVDGVVVPPSEYRLWYGNRLTRLNGSWPLTQDLSRPDSEVGTFSVTYINGYPVDSLGAYAAGVLAVEFAKACTNKACRLPKSVTAIVRQGVTMDLATGLFANGLTGIREVDAFITLWNPRAQKQPTTVWSPEMGLQK